MRLFEKKNIPEVKVKRNFIDKNQLSKPGFEYIVNQAIIWIAIVFLIVVIIERVI